MFGEVRHPRPTLLPDPVCAELIELLGYRTRSLPRSRRARFSGHLTSAFLINQANAALERLRRDSEMLTQLIEAPGGRPPTRAPGRRSGYPRLGQPSRRRS
jgi:hypothetical protein